MSQSCLADLVIAEELEIIICGSTVSRAGCVCVCGWVWFTIGHVQEWDIDALEESTRYDGFTAKQPVIV